MVSRLQTVMAVAAVMDIAIHTSQPVNAPTPCVIAHGILTALAAHIAAKHSGILAQDNIRLLLFSREPSLPRLVHAICLLIFI